MCSVLAPQCSVGKMKIHLDPESPMLHAEHIYIINFQFYELIGTSMHTRSLSSL